MSQEPKNRNDSRKEKPDKPTNWRYWFVFCGFSAFAALLLLQEHRAHLWGMALYLILILCPLMIIVIYREDKSLDRWFKRDVDDDKRDKP